VWHDAEVSPIFLLIGSPAVGKSSTSRALAARFERSVHIPVDDLRDMVVSGRSLPSPEWGAELTRQVALARGTAIRMAGDYVDAGFAVVLDDFWDPNELAEYGALLDRPGVHGVILHPGQDEAHRRNRARAGDHPGRSYIDEGIRVAYQLLAAALPRLDRRRWLVLDTTHLGIEATVDAILDHAGETVTP
jgi:predicted kinase